MGRRDFFLFRARFASFHTHVSLHRFCLSHFILAVPMRECSGEHSSMSSSFPIAILNGACYFPPVQLKVHIFVIWCDNVEILMR